MLAPDICVMKSVATWLALLSNSIMPKRQEKPSLTKRESKRWLPVVWKAGAVVLLPNSAIPKMSLTVRFTLS